MYDRIWYKGDMMEHKLAPDMEELKSLLWGATNWIDAISSQLMTTSVEQDPATSDLVKFAAVIEYAQEKLGEATVLINKAISDREYTVGFSHGQEPLPEEARRVLEEMAVENTRNLELMRKAKLQEPTMQELQEKLARIKQVSSSPLDIRSRLNQIENILIVRPHTAPCD
jgi:hypothetical protein